MFSFANIAPPGLSILHNVLKAQGVDKSCTDATQQRIDFLT